MKNILTITFVALILASCGGGEVDKKAQLEELKKQHAELTAQIKTLEKEIGDSSNAKVKDVVIAEVQPAVFRHFIDVQGSVDADENVDILPLAAGKVMRVLVNEGDAVKVGQVLAELDYDALNKQLGQAQTQLSLAKESFDRQERLWNQKVGSEMQYLQAKTMKESGEQQVAYIQEMISNYIIKSPINGTVDYVGIKVGQLAAANPMMPAFRVINLSGLKVQGEIAESYASKVKRGNTVLIHFPDLNKDVESKISFTEKVIDPLTRSFTTEAALENNPDYHPNMVAILKIIDYENPAALTIPVNVIQNTNNESFVYVAVIEGNKTIARKKVVTVGNTYNGQAEILSGLSANDNVVVAGQLDLVDGMTINAQKGTN